MRTVCIWQTLGWTVCARDVMVHATGMLLTYGPDAAHAMCGRHALTHRLPLSRLCIMRWLPHTTAVPPPAHLCLQCW